MHIHSDACEEFDWEALAPGGWYGSWGKRALTVALLLATLPFGIALSVPIVLVNWAIFGDLRKVLYTQPRVGYRGRVFSIYKFRTMREVDRGAYSSWKDGDDTARVTRFGRFLRCTHLDELAQFINVLRGEMCFIGPRPEMIEIDDWARTEIPDFPTRLAVRPGITGLSQITIGYTGVDVIAYRRKLAADDKYRQSMSLGLDVKILVRTAAWMLRGRGWDWQPPADTNSNSSESTEPQRNAA